MNYETVPAETFGHGLKAISLNLLVREVLAEVGFLTHVVAMQSHRVSRDFAIVLHAGQPFQLHDDHILDGAGWHGSNALVVPDNLSLPPCRPCLFGLCQDDGGRRDPDPPLGH